MKHNEEEKLLTLCNAINRRWRKQGSKKCSQEDYSIIELSSNVSGKSMLSSSGVELRQLSLDDVLVLKRYYRVGCFRVIFQL